jgi:alpha-beta hydrolase superfamily lysophospholipase
MTYEDMAHDLNNFIENIVLKSQNSKEVAIMGHSMGGKASMTLALLYVWCVS